jgi:hypothetical protein
MSVSRLHSCLAAAVAAFASSALATPFSLQYDFVPDSPGAYAPVITGTFEGTRNGDFVEGISQIHMAIDGVPLPPVASLQFFIAGYNDPAGDWSLPPVVSFTLLSNNFAIADSDIGAGDLSADFAFRLIPGGTIQAAAMYSGGLSLGDSDAAPDLGAWKLTELSVPDEGSTAVILLFALAALRLLRRTRQL